jgi:hypothetical protein
MLFSWDSCLLTRDRREGERRGSIQVDGKSTGTSSEDRRQVYTP